MNMRLVSGAFACVMVLCPAVAVLGQPGSAQDKHFVRHSMQDDNSEVQLAHLVLQKTKSADVKQFAQRMIDDHTKLNQRMEPVARGLNLSSPRNITPGAQALEQRLKTLSGAKFDDQYIKAMVRDHTRAVIAFKQEATEGANPQVKQAAEQGLQVIQQHLRMAKQLAQDHHVAVRSKA